MKKTQPSLPAAAAVTAAGMALLLAGCAAVGGAAPTGGAEKIGDEEAAKIKAVGEKVKGKVVWSSSRLGNHDLFTMNTDGSDVVKLTEGDAVDWFPRYSPDGSRILFVRSKKGWVSERDANAEGKWDLFSIAADGSDAKKLVDDASWGTWVTDDTILFVRGTKIYRQKLSEGAESAELLVDSEKVDDLDGALLQQPQMSTDGRYIAITLRGSKRETGIWDVEKKTWTRTGEGCQINWTPDGKAVYWVHPTGNGSSRVFKMDMAKGMPAKELSDDERTFIDLPGRRSHEYFPELSDDGSWLVWAATQRGHDHDIADYEIYLWQVGQPPEQAARLTFHSGNDRWPDIHIPGVTAARASPKAAGTEKSSARNSTKNSLKASAMTSETSDDGSAAEVKTATADNGAGPVEAVISAPAAKATKKKAKGKDKRRARTKARRRR
jgi:Tol biopolymer transport system component